MCQRTVIVAYKLYNSPYADIPYSRTIEPQEQIERCLNCPYEKCINCLGCCEGGKKGRPDKCDLDELRELLKLKKTTPEICAKLGISRSTFFEHKRKLVEV